MTDHMDTGLKCDVEMNVTGPNDTTVKKWTANALRQLASDIEAGKFEDGFHPVKDSLGKEIGKVYFDYYESS